MLEDELHEPLAGREPAVRVPEPNGWPDWVSRERMATALYCLPRTRHGLLAEHVGVPVTPKIE